MKALLKALLIVALALAAARACDIEIEHFEDGSGRITYCIPFSLCD